MTADRPLANTSHHINAGQSGHTPCGATPSHCKYWREKQSRSVGDSCKPFQKSEKCKIFSRSLIPTLADTACQHQPVTRHHIQLYVRNTLVRAGTCRATPSHCTYCDESRVGAYRAYPTHRRIPTTHYKMYTYTTYVQLSPRTRRRVRAAVYTYIRVVASAGAETATLASELPLSLQSCLAGPADKHLTKFAGSCCCSARCFHPSSVSMSRSCSSRE